MTLRRTRWTDEQIATLRRLHGTKTLRLISIIVGMPINSVKTKVVQLGLSKKKAQWKPREVALLREMVEASKTNAEIGEALGKDPTAVQRKRQALGLVQWRQQPRHDEAAKLGALLEDVVLMLRVKAPHREILETIYEGRAPVEKR